MTQSRINYRSITIAIVIVLALSGFIALRYKDAIINYLKPEPVAVGRPAPDFTASDLNGRTIGLADYRGRVVLLNIWATWCRPCVDEMPSLEKLYREFKDQNFALLAVSIDSDGIAAVAPFMTKHGLTFRALIDSQAAIQTSYGITGVPETFIIDKEGILARKVIGPLDWSAPEVLEYIRKLIQAP